MSLVTLIVVVVIVGVVMWLINAYVPMEPRIKSLLNIAVLVVLVLWILSALFGFNLQSFPDIRVGG
jgi:uncharacterized BrkB/YihY/UPF0761 family membrane protein